MEEPRHENKKITTKARRNINEARIIGINKSIEQKEKEAARKLFPLINKVVMNEKNKNGLTLEQAIEKVFSVQALYEIHPELKKERVERYIKSLIRVQEYGSNPYYKVSKRQKDQIKNKKSSNEIER